LASTFLTKALKAFREIQSSRLAIHPYMVSE
jgi:hypothetical protein